VIATFDEVRPGQRGLREYLDNQPVDGPLNDTESYYTGSQRRWLATWLRRCANTLLLNNWTVRLWHEPPRGDAHANVTATEGRVFASFRFENEIFTQDIADAKNHMAHELLHVMLEQATQMVEYDLKGLLGDQALAIFQSTYRRQMEFAVDHLASVLEAALPDPPWAGLSLAERTAKANTTAQERWRGEQPQADVVTYLAVPDATNPATEQ
jgi:hypothetical protein